MKKSIFFLSLAMGLAAVAMAQPEPIQTTKDYGLYGPVKKVTRLHQFYDGWQDVDVYKDISIEFDEQGRRSDGYAYDSKGRMVVGDGTYYAYDHNGRLTSEQYIDQYLVYNYDKTGRLTSCERYQLGKQGRIDFWVKNYKYDKQGRLLGAEAKTTDKKNPTLVFSYQVIYAPDGTPKGYAYTHLGDDVYDEYGELVEAAAPVTDTLPYDAWATYAVNHGTYYDRPSSEPRDYTVFDDEGNGIEWQKIDTLSTDPIYDEYGEIVEAGHDTMRFYTENRTIEYYGRYNYTISLPEMNVLYCGIPNLVKVVVNGVPDKLVILGNEEDSTYDVWTDETGLTYVTPDVSKGRIRIPVNIVENEKVKNIGYQDFRVRQMPMPDLYLGKYLSGSTIPREEMVNMKAISVRYGIDFAFRVKAPVVEKQTIAITKIAGADDLENKGATWSPEIVSYITKIKKSCKLMIEAVVSLPDGRKVVISGAWTVE